MAWTTEKTAPATPIPRASVATATAAKPRLRRRPRQATWRSFSRRATAILPSRWSGPAGSAPGGRVQIAHQAQHRAARHDLGELGHEPVAAPRDHHAPVALPAVVARARHGHRRSRGGRAGETRPARARALAEAAHRRA